jgi:hypothetical protein
MCKWQITNADKILFVKPEANNSDNSKLWTEFGWIWLADGTVCSV